MNIYRQFSDSGEQSHFEKAAPDVLEPLRQWTDAKAFKFNIFPPGTFIDWHVSEGKLLIATLSGRLKITVSDGTSVICEKGDLRIVTDTVGKGHTAEVIGNEPCVGLLINIK